MSVVMGALRFPCFKDTSDRACYFGVEAAIATFHSLAVSIAANR